MKGSNEICAAPSLKTTSRTPQFEATKKTRHPSFQSVWTHPPGAQAGKHLEHVSSPPHLA
eukprot:200441-Amphidinium_carterae.1